jgi:hypothetical protein
VTAGSSVSGDADRVPWCLMESKIMSGLGKKEVYCSGLHTVGGSR